MKYFADSVIKPSIVEQGYKSVCEVGASLGEHSDRLLELGDISMTLVDPCLDVDLAEKYRGDGRVQVRKGLSLDVLGQMEQSFDCILLDGDHNWYTVYNELATIEKRSLLRDGGTVFLHDTAWPYGRRDMYYQPETIPAEFVHEHARRGIVQGQSALSETEGINGVRENAVLEGGPRNGVLTAVEDFAREHSDRYEFYSLDAQSGLGVLFKKGDEASNQRFLARRAKAQGTEKALKAARLVKSNLYLGKRRAAALAVVAGLVMLALRRRSPR